jgi:hypothetical protein
MRDASGMCARPPASACRRAAEEPAEPRYGMKAGSPGRRREVADRHVFDQAAAQGADLGHRRLLSGKVSATRSFRSRAPTATPLPYQGAVSVYPLRESTSRGAAIIEARGSGGRLVPWPRAPASLPRPRAAQPSAAACHRRAHRRAVPPAVGVGGLDGDRRALSGQVRRAEDEQRRLPPRARCRASKAGRWRARCPSSR